MSMSFKKDCVRLVKLKQIENKQKNGFLTFAEVCDKETFESHEFMLSKDSVDFTQLAEGCDFQLNVELNGRFINATLSPIGGK